MKKNYYILWLAFCFWFMETQFFGWNMLPSCVAELACDGFVIFLTALAFMPITVNVTIHEN